MEAGEMPVRPDHATDSEAKLKKTRKGSLDDE